MLSSHIGGGHFMRMQWRSHWGGKGGKVPPLTAKMCQKLGKRGKKSGKKRKYQEEKEKIGKFLSLCPLTDKAGYATVWMANAEIMYPTLSGKNETLFLHL